MRWNIPLTWIYAGRPMRVPGEEPQQFHARLNTGYKRGQRGNGGLTDVPYRDFVEGVAYSEETPSQIIMNRSPDHAAVIIEVLFRTARDRVEILTDGLMEQVYGSDAVINAAAAFLEGHPEGSLEILAESPVDRGSHRFFTALGERGLDDRVSLKFVPLARRPDYKFNFTVVDGLSYRFEEDRRTSEAIVQFREPDFAGALEGAFRTLSQDATATPS